jgi:tetratricopeptide (TPR) repeat protein
MLRFCNLRRAVGGLLVAGLLLAPGVAGAQAKPEKKEEWRALVEAAGYAYEAHRPYQAQDLLEQAVEKTEPGTEARAAVLNNLAIVLEANGYIDAAEQLYGQVIGLWAEVLGPGHPNVSRTLGNLGDLLHRREKMAEAVEAYELAITTLKKAKSTDAIEVRRALYESFAQVLHEMGRDEEAKAARLKAFPPGN